MLAVGVVVGLLVGATVYVGVLQHWLDQSIDTSYGLLPSTPRPWLASLPRLEGPLSYVLALLAVFAMTTVGLWVVLLARPRTAAADLTHGLAVGLVSAYVAFLGGGAWAFAGNEEEATFYGAGENENSYAFKYDQLRGQEETPYPDLQGKSEEDRRRILYDKMACDAVIAVETGLLKSYTLFFAILLVIPAVEALAAGALWRRYQRAWPVVGAYAERGIPLALALIMAVSLVWRAFLFQDFGKADWFAQTQRMYWPREVMLIAMIPAQVASWRRWHWSLRLVLHAGWIGVIVFLFAMAVSR